MKQERINKAHHALLKLMDYKLPVKKAYAIYRLKAAIDSAYEFAVQEEQKYLAEYGGTSNGNGTVTFATPTDCASFRDKMEELNGADIDMDIDIVALTEADFGEQTVAPSDISNLEGFVSFG